MLNRLLIKLFALVAPALMAGCASYMPLSTDNPKPEASKPLYLMSVTVRNDQAPRWQPHILNAMVRSDSGPSAGKVQVFRMDAQGKIDPAQAGSAQTFLVRFTTDGAPSTLTVMQAMASAFPIHGQYSLPMFASLPASGPGVYYLGSVKAVIRKRGDDELRAGSVIPLIDQAVAGASTGTFEVEIVDSFDSDLNMFKRAFPVLNDATVTKSVLPPWDRAKVRQAADKN